MCTVAPLRFISFLLMFLFDNTGVVLALMDEITDHLAKMLLAGDLDIAIMAQPEAFDGRLDLRLLYREPYVIAFPPGHRFAQMNAVPVSEIAGEAYLLR